MTRSPLAGSRNLRREIKSDRELVASYQANDPFAHYLEAPRTSGRSEGRARDVLEEEKRRRYAQHTLLGAAMDEEKLGR